MSNEIDQLTSLVNSVDLSTVQTSFPLLQSGVCQFQVQECGWQMPEDTAKQPFLHIKMVTTQPWKTVPHEGAPVKEVAPGFPMTHRIYVGKYIDKKGEEKTYGIDAIARFRESAFGKASTGTRFNPEEMLGQMITVRLNFNPAPKNDKTGEVYGPRTEVVGFVAKKA